GLAFGYEARGSSSANLGPPAPDSGSGVLSIVGAGTLGDAFPALASLLVNQTAGVSIPSTAQEYEGSLAALGLVASSPTGYDVAASADYRLIPQLLEPKYSSWEVLFASDPEVLTYDPSVSALAGINTSNWAEKIQSPGVLLGVANATTDPTGYNEIFTLELEGLLENGSEGAVYGHFFEGAPGTLASVNPSHAKVESETEVASLLSLHEISAFITYRSYAISHDLAYVPLDPRVNLGSFSPTDEAGYANATTMILSSSGGTVLVTGAPVAFSATVPSNAPNATLGVLFVHLALSSEGEALLQAMGFTPLVPGYAVGPGSLPTILQPEVVGIPSVLPGGLSA
ncbi:MAG: substrate-binding domain-containing protein, partial [Thermoplasmata archaeon]